MQQVTEKIREFVQSTFQLTDFPVGARDLISFSIGEEYQLFFETRKDSLLVYVSVRIKRSLSEKYLQILKFCHFSNSHKYPLQVGLAKRNSILLLTHIPIHKVSTGEIKSAFEQLYDLALRLVD